MRTGKAVCTTDDLHPAVAGIDPYQIGRRRCRGTGVCIRRLLTVVSVTGIRPAHRPVRVLHEEIVPRHPQGHQAPAVRRPRRIAVVGAVPGEPDRGAGTIVLPLTDCTTLRTRPADIRQPITVPPPSRPMNPPRHPGA